MVCDFKDWDWDDFDKFEDVINKYMPSSGEGETLASQTVTAVNKLVYKFFNDGDVFDNTYVLEGWWNDLSSYANWLAIHVNFTKPILDRIKYCRCCDDYAELLYDLCTVCLDEVRLRFFDAVEKAGSIYDCGGEYKFIDRSYEEEYEDEEEEE